MASLINKQGRWSLQFRLRPNSERATIALGTMTEATARDFQRRVNALVDAVRADEPHGADPLELAKGAAG